jgi:putative flippase GtrA
VRLVRLLPERWRCLAHEMLKFGIVGGINTLVDFVVFNILLPIGPLKANVVSTVVATTASYGMNRHWTYRDRPRSALRREYVLFFLLNLAGFVIQSAVLGVVKYGLHFTEDTGRIALNVGKAAGIAVAMVFRFWAYRTFVFQTGQVAEAAAIASGIEHVPATPIGSGFGSAAAATATASGFGSAVPATEEPVAEDEFAQLTGPLEAELAAPGEETSGQPAVAGLDAASMAAEVARTR